MLNPIAEIGNVDSGDIKTPEEASLMTDNPSFFCPDFDCKDPQRRLSLKKSSLNNLFFSHRPNCEHDIRPETLLHKLAIKWFESKTEFEIPFVANSGKRIRQQMISLDPQKTSLEYSRMKTIIPDVMLCALNGFEFAIEIVVTNDVSDAKKKLISEFGLPTLRIDLNEFYLSNKVKCQVDKQFIEQHLSALLGNINLKSWVVKPDLSLIPSEMNPEVIPSIPENPGCLLVLPIIALFLLFICHYI